MGLKLIYYYAIIIVVLTTAFFVGYLFHSVIKPSKKNPQTLFSVFANAVMGLVILVSIYSIIITSGKTVSWIYILLLLGYSYFLKLNSTTDDTPVVSGHYLKAGLSLSLVSVFFYFLYLSSLLDFKALRFTDTFCDWQFYSKISQYLNLGFESTTQFDNIAFGATFTPYHYFEIWIAAAISRVFDVPSQVATSIIMPTVLGCVSFVGVWGFATKLNYKNAVFTFLLLFISSVTFFSSVLNRLGLGLPLLAGDISSVVSYFKLYPILIFFVLSIHYLLKKDLLLCLCSLLFIPVVSFILAPCILVFVCLLALYLVVINVRDSESYRLVIFLLIYSILLLIYYFGVWDVTTIKNTIAIQDVERQLLELLNPLLLLVNITPFLLYIYLFKKQVFLNNDTKVKIIIAYFSLLSLSAVLASISIGNYDGIQFFTNTFIPLSTAVISLFLLRLNIADYRSNFIVNTFFVVLLLSSVFYSVKYIVVQRRERNDPVFIRQIVNGLKPIKLSNVYCGFLHSTNYYSQFYMHSISNVFRVGESVDCYRNNFLEVGLSDYDALDWLQNKYKGTEASRQKGLARIPEGTFYKFVELQKKTGEFNSVESSQLNFIDQFKIDYIFIQNDASISRQLSGRIVLLAAENSKVGYSFYKIIR